MKKKVFIILGIAAIAVCAVIIAVLLLMPKTSKSTSIAGSWKIVSRNNKTAESEYILFEDGVFSYFVNNSGTASITSKYEQTNDVLKINELSHDFNVHYFTKNYVELRELDTYETWRIIRCSFSVDSEIQVEPVALYGEWDVVMHAGNQDVNEKLVFTDTELQDYRDGKDSPAMAGTYSISGNIIQTDLVDGDVFCCMADENTLMLIQLSDNYVWELTNK